MSSFFFPLEKTLQKTLSQVYNAQHCKPNGAGLWRLMTRPTHRVNLFQKGHLKTFQKGYLETSFYFLPPTYSSKKSNICKVWDPQVTLF